MPRVKRIPKSSIQQTQTEGKEELLTSLDKSLTKSNIIYSIRYPSKNQDGNDVEENDFFNDITLLAEWIETKLEQGITQITIRRIERSI